MVFRLINGSNLAPLENFYRVVEKGFNSLANKFGSTYIKGDFNLHQRPQFSTVREEFRHWSVNLMGVISMLVK